MDTIGEVTHAELQCLIDEWVKTRVTELLRKFDITELEHGVEGEPDHRTWEQVKHDVERDRWIPPPDAKSSL